MPDIIMCYGGHCRRKKNCHRYTAQPSDPVQDYFSHPPIIEGQCAYFIENKEAKRCKKMKTMKKLPP